MKILDLFQSLHYGFFIENVSSHGCGRDGSRGRGVIERRIRVSFPFLRLSRDRRLDVLLDNLYSSHGRLSPCIAASEDLVTPLSFDSVMASLKPPSLDLDAF